ncbi:MAG: glycosyltransferase family 2 protein [Betaproteobacteria bacterium]|nr:glycosyltransferase family 2 protein [Betaproteobacteria bacterium]
MRVPASAAAEPAAVPPTLQLVRENRPAGAGAPPLITVVVCAYRHAAYIDECLASVDATAPGIAIELIVIDDGSPDDTLARCLAFAFRTDLRLRIYTKPNQGLVHSLQCGLGLAAGRYFAVMASDDSYVPGGLEKVQAALLASESTIGALICQAAYLAEHGNPIDGRPVYGQAHAVLLRGSAAERLDAVCTEYPKPLLLQASVFETRLLREIGVWHDGLALDDWPTFIRIFMAEAANKTSVRYCSDIVLARYRLHGDGVHNRLDRQLRLTEQVARELVPPHYRAACLANVRIDIGLIHLYGGNRAYGLWLCLRGLLTAPTPRTVGRIWRRGARALSRRLRPTTLRGGAG